MTMKRILHCTLIFMVLVTSGCDSINSIIGSSQTTDSQNPEWTTMSEQVNNLLQKINTEGGVELKVSDIIGDVQTPLSRLEKDNNEFKSKCSECSPEVLKKAEEAR